MNLRSGPDLTARTVCSRKPAQLFPEESLFDGLARRSMVVSWRKIIDSAYNLRHCGRAERLAYDDLAGFLEQTVRAVRSGPERKFIYAYWPQFDALSHQHGGSCRRRAERGIGGRISRPLRRPADELSRLALRYSLASGRCPGPTIQAMDL